MADLAFSDDGKYFSAISPDGRLRIWDTETNVLKQEFTPDLHLSSPPSCLIWILVRNTDTPKPNGRRRSSSSEQQNQCIALGTANGKILIYSVAAAKVETVLEDSQNSDIQSHAITSLDWHRKYGLFSSNKEGFVHEWDLRNASVKNKYNVVYDSKNKQASKVSAIKIIPHTQNTPAVYLVAASWQVRVWRLHRGACDPVQTLGHSGAPRPVLLLATLDTGCWLVEGSQNERLLSFWDVTVTPAHVPQTTVNGDVPQINGDDNPPTKRQRKKSTTEPVHVAAPTCNFVLEDAPKTVDVAVRHSDGGVKVEVAAATRSGVVHYYGHMLNGSSKKPIKPSVTIQVTTEEATPLPLQCCRFTDNGGGELTLGYDSAPGRVHFERVRPDLKSKTQVLIRGSKARAVAARGARWDTDDVTYLEPLGGVARKRAESGAKVEVPMEARLANLALDTSSRGKSAVNQNLTKLLVQGLHSKDKTLILTVLQSDDDATALRTVSHLPADYVPSLLAQLADMAARRTSQCAAVCTWLNALLRSHAALLLATVGARSSGDSLTKLLAIFTQRRSHLCQLLNLQGRVELTVSQRTAKYEPAADTEAVLEYNDSSSDEEMTPDNEYQSDAASWDDDKFEASASEDSD